MREEVLRLDRVTCMEHGVTELNHFCLNVFAGEIMGIVPVNSIGMRALLSLLRQNTRIHYGYIYYRDRLVNHWRHADNSYNRISVIEGRSGLADDLTVADNVFVLRPGFGKRVIRQRVLREQLAPFLEAIDVRISADMYARDLTTFQRYVVELVKAVVAGNRLIILADAGTTVSDVELARLHAILRHYAREGISFLYISQHYEEIRQVCDRTALMVNGQIVKFLSPRETRPEMIHSFDVDNYHKLVLRQQDKRAPPLGVAPALEIDGLRRGTVEGLDLSVAQGECVVVQDLDNRLIEDLLGAMDREELAEDGAIRVGGMPLSRKNHRELAVIQKLAPQTMLFPELSYLDNLCFAMDHRLPKVWRRAKPRENIRQEYAQWLGDDVFDKSIDELSQRQKYDLIYARTLLQRPRVAICVQPFMQADVEQRMHIWKLLEKLLAKEIAVVILAVNLADTLSLADRLVRTQNGRVMEVYGRGDFGSLPESTPWHHLWDEGH